MNLFKKLFAAEDKQDNLDALIKLQRENLELKERHHQSQETIKELKNQLHRSQEREGFISDVLIDAKLLSQNLLSGTKELAEEEAKTILNDARERLAQAEQSLQRFVLLEQTFAHYEETLKRELRSIFEDYLAKVETLSLSQYVKDLQAPLEEEFQQVKDELLLSKTIVTFPQEQVFKESEPDVVPLYSLDDTH